MKDDRTKNKILEVRMSGNGQENGEPINDRCDIRAIQFLMRSPSNLPARVSRLPYSWSSVRPAARPGQQIEHAEDKTGPDADVRWAS